MVEVSSCQERLGPSSVADDSLLHIRKGNPAVTFAPAGDVVLAALRSLDKGGIVAINAIHLDRMPEFDYDSILWGERQIRSVANMTRDDGHAFLKLAAEINLRPEVTLFRLEQANDALLAQKEDRLDRTAVILPHS